MPSGSQVADSAMSRAVPEAPWTATEVSASTRPSAITIGSPRSPSSSATGHCTSASPSRLSTRGTVRQCTHPLATVGCFSASVGWPSWSGMPIQPTMIVRPESSMRVCGA